MKKLTFLMFAALLFVSASVALAQKNIVVEPGSVSTQSFYVNVSVDHENRIYQEGELMTVTVGANKTGYLYLFYTDASGHVTLLFPNSYHRDNHIKAGRKVTVPNHNMNFKLRTSGPFGKEYLQAIVSVKPIDIQSVTGYQGDKSLYTFSNAELAGVKSLIDRDRGIVVEGYSNSGGSASPASYVRDGMAEYTIEITTVPNGHVPHTQKRRFFVAIGVSKYTDSRIRNLPACEKDVIEMTKFFSNSSAVDKDDILVVFNEKATKENIRKLFFDVLPQHTKPGDEVIIFWTGHGGRCADTDGDEKDRYDETLILYDTDATDPKTQLTDDEFGRWVQNLSGRKVLFIFDTCHSGGLAENAKSLGSFSNAFSDDYVNNSRQSRSIGSINSPSDSDADLDWDFGLEACASVKDIGQANLAVIASCAKTEPSLVMEEKGLSVMTSFILEELKKGSGITHEQLYRRIKPKVYDYVKQRYEAFGQNVTFQDDFSQPMIVNP